MRTALGALSAVLRRYGAAGCGELASARAAMVRALAAIEAGEEAGDATSQAAVDATGRVEWTAEEIMKQKG